jgi:hypothetical protein
MNDHIDSVEYLRQFRLIKITASTEYGGKRLSLNILDEGENYYSQTN